MYLENTRKTGLLKIGRRCARGSNLTFNIATIKVSFQNHPQRYEKPVSYYSDTAIDQRKIPVGSSGI